MRVGTNFLILFSLPFLLLLLPFSTPLSDNNNNNGTIPSRTLDALLQDYAFKALLRPKTGVPYVAEVPNNLSGVIISAMRLRSGSLRTRGFHSYNEFQIPIGVFVSPYVQRLVLVYHNLGNWSENFYPIPGYRYLSPVLGLLAYNGTNLSSSDLPELDLRVSEKPILIKFNDVKSAPYGSVAKCVYFDLHGSVQFDELSDGNVCPTLQQGHFSIVVESNDYAPSPAPTTIDAGNSGEKKKKESWIWIIVASVVGGFVLLILLILLIAKVRRNNRRMKIQQLEWAADSNEALQMKSVGDTKAPSAVSTRTRPTLENDYIP